jgi:hypothetical protein
MAALQGGEDGLRYYAASFEYKKREKYSVVVSSTSGPWADWFFSIRPSHDAPPTELEVEGIIVSSLSRRFCVTWVSPINEFESADDFDSWARRMRIAVNHDSLRQMKQCIGEPRLKS